MCDAAVRFATDIAISCRLLRVAMLRAACGPKIGRWQERRPVSPIVRSRPRPIFVANEGEVAFSTVSEGNSRLRDSIPENPTTKRARHALFGRTENSCRHARLALAEWI